LEAEYLVAAEVGQGLETVDLGDIAHSLAVAHTEMAAADRIQVDHWYTAVEDTVEHRP
jgi:hypothetical protein